MEAISELQLSATPLHVESMTDQVHPDWLMQEESLGSKVQDVETPEHTPGVQEQPMSDVQVVLSVPLLHIGGAPVQLPLLVVPPPPRPAASEIDAATTNVILYIIPFITEHSISGGDVGAPFASLRLNRDPLGREGNLSRATRRLQGARMGRISKKRRSGS